MKSTVEIVESAVSDYQAHLITADQAAARIETETNGGITAAGAKSYLELHPGTYARHMAQGVREDREAVMFWSDEVAGRTPRS